MSVYSEYQSKLVTPEQAVKVIKSGDWVDYGFGMNIVDLLDTALAKRKDELTDVKIRACLAVKPLAVIEEDPELKAFTYNTFHMGGYERKRCAEGRAFFIPFIFTNMPRLYRDHLHVDVAMSQVSKMDENGYFTVSLSNAATVATHKKALISIVEVNEHMPTVIGGRDHKIHISEIDYVVEGKHDPLVQLPTPPASEVDKAIAGHVMSMVTDGSVVQLGIGAMPNALGHLMASSDLKDLSCHTEMLGDAYIELYKAGKLTNQRKQIDKGRSAWAIALGTQELFDWLHENDELASYPVDYINSPAIMAQNDNLISINSAIEVDLFGQVCAESSGIKHISGTGGQLDFLTGSFNSNGGKGFICLPSTYVDKKTGDLKSRVVPTLPPGGIVTDPRSQAYYIVTEHGAVNLAGRATWERSEALISVAHPELRDQLIKDAEKMGIWRKSNKR